MLLHYFMFGKNKVNKDKLIDFLFTYFYENADIFRKNINSSLTDIYLGRMDAACEIIRYLNDDRK